MDEIQQLQAGAKFPLHGGPHRRGTGGLNEALQRLGVDASAVPMYNTSHSVALSNSYNAAELLSNKT